LLLWRCSSDFSSAVNASGRQRLMPGASALEAPRHHSHDGVRLAVDAQVLADRAGIGGEEAPPEPSLSSTFFSFPGSPSSFVNARPSAGRRPHHAQVRRAGRYDLDAHRPAVFVEAPLPVLKNACSSETLVARRRS
jgi:hypothetical protein